MILRRALLAASLALVLSSSCNQPKLRTPSNFPIDPGQQPPAVQRPRLVWISLDGLRRSEIETLVKSIPAPHPKGFAFLLSQTNWNAGLAVTNPTITASSHISTLTCTPPGVHGIVANRQWNGEKFVSGFSEKFLAESFVAALRKQNIRTASIGYPGLDGTDDNRSASLGTSYDNPLPDDKPRYLDVAYGAQASFAVRSRVVAGRKLDVTVTVSPTGDELTFKLPDGSMQLVTKGQWAGVQFVEEGIRQEVSALYYADANSKAKIYVGPTSLNNAYPSTFRERLDSERLVFSNAKDYSMLNVSDALYLKGMEHRLNYFATSGRLVLEKEDAEALFLYFEDLDTLGHQYAGDTTKEVVRREHFEKLDAALGSLLQNLPSTTNVVVVGDHGMSSINYEVNSSKLIPKEHVSKFVTNVSGGALFLHGIGSTLESLPPTGETWFESAVASLREAKVEFDGNGKVFERVVVKGSSEARALGLEGKTMPWIMAFARSGVGIRQSIEDKFLVSRRKTFLLPLELREKYPDTLVNGKLVEPLYGAHGHWSVNDDVRTSLVMFGPELDKVDAQSIESNLEIVPYVADALTWQRPEGCLKRAIEF